jgi:hypothetical protein
LRRRLPQNPHLLAPSREAGLQHDDQERIDREWGQFLGGIQARQLMDEPVNDADKREDAVLAFDDVLAQDGGLDVWPFHLLGVLD